MPARQAAGDGVIITIASRHGLLMAPTFLVFEAEKGAVIGRTLPMACHVGPLASRVNAFCPGHIVAEPIRVPSPPARWQVAS